MKQPFELKEEDRETIKKATGILVNILGLLAATETTYLHKGSSKFVVYDDINVSYETLKDLLEVDTIEDYE